MIPSKSSLFNKIPTWLVEDTNKIPTFWVNNKNFSKNLVFALKKFVFCCPDPGSGIQIRNPDPDWEKKPRIRICKKQNQIRNTADLKGTSYAFLFSLVAHVETFFFWSYVCKLWVSGYGKIHLKPGCYLCHKHTNFSLNSRGGIHKDPFTRGCATRRRASRPWISRPWISRPWISRPRNSRAASSYR